MNQNSNESEPVIEHQQGTMRLWWVVRWLPKGFIRYFKSILGTKTKLQLRRLLGGKISKIPDSVVTVPDGRRFRVGPSIAYWSIYYTNDYESECTALLRDLLNPGDIVLDVGANIGWYSTLCALLVGKTGRVVAFEPVPSNYAALSENIFLNNMEKDVYAHRIAVGDRNGEIEIYSFPHERGSDSLSTLGRDNYSKSRAPMVTLDDFLSQQHIGAVNLVKCDVEGAELMVLRGGRRLFLSDNAPMVLIELNDETGAYFGFDRARVLEVLQGYGYDYFLTIPAPFRVKRVSDAADLGTTNMLFACKGSYAHVNLSRRHWAIE